MTLLAKKMNFSGKIVTTIKSLVVCALFAALIYVNMTRPRVLILHSYAEDFSWVTDFNTAFRNSFKHPSNPIIYYSYMNTLNKQTTRYKNRAGQEAIQMINTLRPDIILGIFTDANEYAVQNFRDKPHVQIIYNIKSDPAKLQYDTAKNVQGIKAGPALKDLNDILLLATPKRPIRIAHIGDQSSSVRLYDKYIVEHLWRDAVLIDSVLVDNFTEWKEAVDILSGQADYIVVSKYFALTSEDGKTMVPTKKVMKWTMENSKVPIVGLYTAVVEEGGDVAVEDSPFEQGEMMATMTSTLLDKKPIVPKMRSIQHFVELGNDKSRVTLPEVYHSFSTALKEYKRH
jgi:ABC-type uncharacterized transport system substrate-binding protein